MYGKFFSSTFTGSMFGAGSEVFAVWGYVIANAIDSTVELNHNLLAAVLGSTPEKMEEAIQFLCRPDPKSRNPDEDGRRLIPIGQFNYHVVSHEIYRALRNEQERREYNRLKQQESRERRKGNVNPNVNDSQLHVSTVSHGQPPSAYTEADIHKEETSTLGDTAKAVSHGRGKLLGTLPLNTGVYEIHQDDYDRDKPLYPAVDVLQEYRGMKAWLLANPQKRKTKQGIRRFMNNWLSKAQDKGKPTGGNNAGTGTSRAEERDRKNMAAFHDLLSGDENPRATAPDGEVPAGGSTVEGDFTFV